MEFSHLHSVLLYLGIELVTDVTVEFGVTHSAGLHVREPGVLALSGRLRPRQLALRLPFLFLKGGMVRALVGQLENHFLQGVDAGRLTDARERCLHRGHPSMLDFGLRSQFVR